LAVIEMETRSLVDPERRGDSWGVGGLLQFPAASADSHGVRLFMTALLIWCAISVPIALAVGRMLGGGAEGDPPNPPIVRQPARNHLVRS